MMNIVDCMSFAKIKYNGKDEIAESTTEFKKDKESPKLIVPFCEVQLYDQQKREHIKSVWSDKNGIYSFPNLNRKDFKYFIIAHHPKAEFNGVIADNIGRDDVDD